MLYVIRNSVLTFFEFALSDISPSEDTIAAPDILVSMLHHLLSPPHVSVLWCFRIASRLSVREARRFLYDYFAVTMKHRLEGIAECPRATGSYGRPLNRRQWTRPNLA